MRLLIRPATDDDVDAMSAVLIASISELCAADHRNDPEIIANWTRNKSPDGVRLMLANPKVWLVVAERGGSLVAVGCGSRDGEILLNYVAPAHRFAGVSKALLAAMEERIRAAGVSCARLTSTGTAHRFYQSAGWEDAGPPELGPLTAPSACARCRSSGRTCARVLEKPRASGSRTSRAG